VSSQPAQRWEEALVTGNGNIGVMVFGRPYEETLVVNHCKLYLPLDNREIVQDFAESMPAFKAAGLKAGMDGPAVVHKMKQARTTQKIVPTDPFHPAFLLSLKMSPQGQARACQRTQDLGNGEVTVPEDYNQRHYSHFLPLFEAIRWDRPTGRIELSLMSGADQALCLRLPQNWSFSSVDLAGDGPVPKISAAPRLCQLKLCKDQAIKLSIRFTEGS